MTLIKVLFLVGTAINVIAALRTRDALITAGAVVLVIACALSYIK